MQMIDEENYLIMRAIHGDTSAFEQLVQQNENLMYTIAARMCGNYEDAQDCVQNAMMRIYRGLNGFRGDASFSSWACRITMNACLDEMRRRKRQKHFSLESLVEEGWAPADDTHTPERFLSLAERQEVLSRAISSLSPNMRVVIILRDVQGRSYKEIARLLSLNEGTVKSRLNRGRAKLQELISADLHKEDSMI